MKKRIKVLFFSFLIVFFSFFSISSAKADSWGTAYGSEGMGQMMDEIQKMIHGVIIGALRGILILIVTPWSDIMI